MPQETVTSPIPGAIVKISVEIGSQISEGDTICEIESMKMENPVPSPIAGTVIEVIATHGQLIKEGDALIVIEN